MQVRCRNCWSMGVTRIILNDIFNKVVYTSSKHIINNISSISYSFFITANEEQIVVLEI